MKLSVAGRDESHALGARLAREAAERARAKAPRFLMPEHTALGLRDCSDGRDFRRRFLRLVAMRYGVDFKYEPPVRPGLRGKLAALLKELAWKLVRYRLERLVDQQNVFNELIAHTLEFELRALDDEIGQLEARLARLEAPGDRS